MLPHTLIGLPVACLARLQQNLWQQLTEATTHLTMTLQAMQRILLLLGLALTSCAGKTSTSSSWSQVAAADLDVSQEAQLELALSAKQAMMGTLMKTLSTEMAANGPAGAIAVCKERAPEVADEVGAELGVRIGRTSFKLRNPQNSGPRWAQPLLEERPTEPRFSASEGGALGVTLPILLQTKCLGCHGAKDSLPAPIREALAELYPDDQATGFAAGDLRGWFWVEVPALAR